MSTLLRRPEPQASSPAPVMLPRAWTRAFEVASKMRCGLHDAEDIASETLLRLLASDPPPRQPIAWAYTVARNLVLRRERRRPVEPLDEAAASDARPYVACQARSRRAPATRKKRRGELP